MEFNDVSYDIFEWFPILYCQDVFKYLSGKDVLEASLVNKQWHKFTAESQQAAKLKLVFRWDDGKEFSCDVVDMLKNSKRRYQHIEFEEIPKENMNFMDFLLQILADRAGWWKSLTLDICERETDLEKRRINEREIFSEALRIIEPTVEAISMSSLRNPKEALSTDPNWTFPNLKFLEINSGGYDLWKCFARCTSLLKFHWKSCVWAHLEKEDSIHTILSNNHNINDLSIASHPVIFSSEFKFKLKNLRLHAYPLEDDVRYSFLITHALSLESLKFGQVELDQKCLELILANMPNLTSLSMSFIRIHEAMQNWLHEFPVNTMITSLGLRDGVDEREINSGTFETLIRALPNLKHFKCYAIIDDRLLELSRAAPELESFETDAFNISRFPEGDIFPDMKEFKTGWFHNDFQEPRGDSNFAALVRKAMREAI